MGRFAFVWALGFLAVFPVISARADTQLDGTISEYTEAIKHADPYMAPIYGVEEDLGKFGDYPSPEYYDRFRAIYEKALAKLQSVDSTRLSDRDRLTYRLFKDDVETSLKSLDFPNYALDFNQMGNRIRAFIDDTSETLTYFPFDSVKHYDDFLSRAAGFPDYVALQIDALRRGMAMGITLNCDIVKKTIETYREALEPVVEKNPFYRPVLFMPKTFSDADRTRLTSAFTALIHDKLLPAMYDFDAFFRATYAPACRASYGIGDLPRGKEWYAQQILVGTNLPLDPADVHALGLKEVDRISAEIDQVRQQLGFTGSYQDFLKSLLSDPRYFYKTSAEMFDAFKGVREAVSKKIPQYFSLVPKTDYKIVEAGNPNDAAGMYMQPSDSSPFGRFVVNTHNLRAVPVYEVTTLSLHESIPGHHFQLALQYEMRDQLSEYLRKIYQSNAFAEGWALYSEYLGREMGMFDDPVQRLGNLNDEMLRAVRLVVDTGIHAMGWTREQTMAYMTAHLASDPGDNEVESDRYSVWPGQALGYKIGQLKIIELRKLAEQELGAKFDLREFHRVVIGSGTVSLPVLEEMVKDWIARTK